MKQILSLIRQNSFFSAVSIVGTALSVAFVMVVYMAYDIQTANLAPEVHRDRMLYSGYGYSYRKADHSNANSGMSWQTCERLFGSLPGVELVAYIGPKRSSYCGASSDGGRKRQVCQVDLNYWKMYEVPLLAGRLFSNEEMEAGRKDVCVVSAGVAREEFGSVEAAVGKNLFIDFSPRRVVGVTATVSPLFPAAYGEVWMPYSKVSELDAAYSSEGLRGSFEAMLLVREGVRPAEVMGEVEASLRRLNGSLGEYHLELPAIEAYTEGKFFPNEVLNPAALCTVLVLILLIVPAINISGLISSQMGQRMAELAVRKAYGASRRTLMLQLLRENLALSLLGALAGFILSCLLLWIGKEWMLGVSEPHLELSVWLFLRPSVFAVVFMICLLFNFLSVFVPAWSAIRRPIVEVLGGE